MTVLVSVTAGAVVTSPHEPCECTHTIPGQHVHASQPRAAVLQVCQLQQLQKVTVPFALGSSHLRLLCRLPDLQHLYSWRQIELDILGPAHNPLTQVQQLVCHSIHGRGKELGAWFPALESLVVKHCSDMAALSLKGCVGLQELLTAECGQLSDEGFACLKDCKGLQRLQLEGASQVRESQETARTANESEAVIMAVVAPAKHTMQAWALGQLGWPGHGQHCCVMPVALSLRLPDTRLNESLPSCHSLGHWFHTNVASSSLVPCS